MSSALAIAGVTAVLRDLLNDAFVANDVSGIVGGNVVVSAIAPDRVLVDGVLAQPQLNIYMYMATPNTGWNNQCLPSRNSQGQRTNNPALALDLHYLLTAYGIEDLQAEILLGHAMQLLHENPVPNRTVINDALNSLQVPLQTLSTSGLAEQVEQIKFTPEYMNTEEMSKLWTAAQSNYRPTAAYEATVVLIETEEPVQSALPVRERTVNVISLQRPTIETVTPERIEVGAELVLQGQNLAGDATQLRFGETLISPEPEDVFNQQITLILPATLSAGIQGVQVVHELNIGIPPTPHRGVESNVAPFVLLPRIETNPIPNVAQGNTLTIEVTPPVTRRQRASIMLGEQEIKIPPRPDTDPVITTELEFPIPAGFGSGDFLVRLRIDGAESVLSVDEITREYSGPTVTVT
ncbi:MAG: DUF4255 domain-containing protein [Gammaproteobacteria bacterium]|nr:DUF4255 domain-containing protein [Gammaproteobacteria bacterium]